MPSFVTDYANAAARAAAFLNPDYLDDTRRTHLALSTRAPLTPDIAKTLVEQNSAAPASPLRQQALRGIGAHKDVVFVVTGQQLGVCLGPLFTLYKAVSAIKLARHLAKQTGRLVLPLFWLQSEDHDRDEIAAIDLAPPLQDTPASPPQRLVLMPQGQARASVASCHYADTTLLHQAAPAALADVVSHYKTGASVVDAFAAALLEVFKNTELLVFNPRCASVAKAALTLHHQALDRHQEIAAALQSRCVDLARAGYGVQIPPRPECALSFFHPQGIDGPRYRVVPKSKSVALAGHGFETSYADWRAMTTHEPLLLSSSALLRPLIQDSVLPTVAYVGGPAEVAYFSQLSPLYHALGVPMPLVVPRMHATLVTPADQAQLAELNLTVSELQAPLESLVLRAARHRSATSPHGARAQHIGAQCQAALAHMNAALESLKGDLVAIDPSLHKSLAKTKRSVNFAVSRLQEKAKRAAAVVQDPGLAAHLATLRWRLMPRGAPQERCYGLLWLARHGAPQTFVDTLLEICDPFDRSFREIGLPST